ncbi:MAG: YicC family protein [Betaproteobacteria bacterium]|nr:YicC family protein [Betaproteobacteria bacterium]
MSVLSMTGFAVASANIGGDTLNVELRAVNHRYLDVTVKTPDELRLLEPVLRERLAARMKRGKVDCRVSRARNPEAAPGLRIDAALVAALLAVAGEIHAQASTAAPLTVNEILRWPGVLAAQDAADETLSAATLTVFDAAWDDFAASRTREGGKLATVLLQCCDAMEAQVARVMPRIPAIHAAYQAKLTSRLQEAGLDPDEERLKQELALFATRIEISEEVTRLATHIDEVRRVLGSGGAVGKRLDFLAQELHREANTLGAKSVDVELSQVALELKVLIEQMREQIQNLE